MKSILLAVLACILVTAVHGEWFLHRSTIPNSITNYTLLAPHLTNQQSANLFVTPIQRPFHSKHVDRSIGLWFPSSRQRWSIFYEQNTVAMTQNLEFAVYRAGAGDTTFRHQHASAGNPFRRSYLDHPSLNNQPAAFPFITQNWDLSGVYNPILRYNVIYSTSLNRWYLEGHHNTDEFALIPETAGWNVLVRSAGPQTFRHIVSANGLTSTLDHPTLNGNPQALLLVTRENVEGSLGAHFTRVQARYDATLTRWILESLTPSALRQNARYLITTAVASDTPLADLRITSDPPRNLIEVDTEFGFSYQMQTAVTLGTWLDEGIAFSGNGETQTYPTSVVLPSQFYRAVRTLE